jgi:hypothetical protein
VKTREITKGKCEKCMYGEGEKKYYYLMKASLCA